MTKTVRIIAISMMVVSVVVLIFTQWTPVLALIPAGVVMTLWGGDYFSTTPSSRNRPSHSDLYE